MPPAQRRRQFKAARTPVTVEVQPIGRPIVLVVCSYGPTQWDVRIANDANVKRVIVGGYETQQVTGAPENVPVEVHTYEGPRRSAHHFYTMGPGTEGHDAAMAKLRALTSMEVVTFEVNRHYAGGAIVVGPGSDEWAAQRLQLDLRPVYHEAVAYSLA